MKQLSLHDNSVNRFSLEYCLMNAIPMYEKVVLTINLNKEKRSVFTDPQRTRNP
jgi:hypothetical protein